MYTGVCRQVSCLISSSVLQGSSRSRIHFWKPRQPDLIHDAPNLQLPWPFQFYRSFEGIHHFSWWGLRCLPRAFCHVSRKSPHMDRFPLRILLASTLLSTPAAKSMSRTSFLPTRSSQERPTLASRALIFIRQKVS